MFAPKPFDVAKEMVRVTRPGGRIVMGNWIQGDPTLVAQILKISASGPTMNAFEAAARSGRAVELRSDLQALFESQNKSQNTTTSIDAAFLRVTVTASAGCFREKDTGSRGLS